MERKMKKEIIKKTRLDQVVDMINHFIQNDQKTYGICSKAKIEKIYIDAGQEWMEKTIVLSYAQFSDSYDDSDGYAKVQMLAPHTAQEFRVNGGVSYDSAFEIVSACLDFLEQQKIKYKNQIKEYGSYKLKTLYN
jgi:hypothetical protein